MKSEEGSRMNVPAAKQTSTLGTWKTRLGLPFAVVATILVWFMPAQPGLSVLAQKALALFAGIFVLYITEAISLPVTSLAIVPLSVLLGIEKPGPALAGFASTSVYLMIGAFILATAMVKSKLADRITYYIMSIVGTTTVRISLGITLANIVLAFLVPSSTARTAILLPVCLSIIGAAGKGEGRSNFAASLLLTLAFTNATISAGILTATVPNPVTIDFIVKAGGPAISFADWFVMGFPPALLMTGITWWFIQKFFPSEIKEVPGGADHVKEQLAALGPITKNEQRAFAVFILVVGLWITGGYTKINPTIACLAGSILLFLPKIGFLTWKDAERGVSWQIVMVTGGGISMGDILMRTGAAKWLAVSIFNTLGLSNLSLIMMLVVLMFIVQYMHIFFVGTTTMATAFLPIVMGMAQVAHVNPAFFALPAGMIIGGYPLLMFYCTLPNILVYDTGKLRVEDFPKVGLVVCTIGCIVYAGCALTYWKWLGI
ncbi:MAG: DASS family sodium-coupled anion symporter [Veillonellaceae bacterium]|nr:DASS family sodium-coupled anion symporter [Veillonellaceae bacterium]